MRIKFATTRLKAFFADADVGDDDKLLVLMVMMEVMVGMMMKIIVRVVMTMLMVGMVMNFIVTVVILILMVKMVMNTMVMMTEADQVCNNQAAKPLFL